MAGIAAAAATAVSVAVNCWSAAAVRYDLPVDLLFAIGQVESSHMAHAVAVNTNGTADLGIMQINSSWLRVLEPYGIDRRVLLEQPCTNIQVGAWILAQEVARFGYSWQAIGAYNAGPITSKMSQERRERKLAQYQVYGEKVLARWQALRQLREQRQAPAPTVMGDASYAAP